MAGPPKDNSYDCLKRPGSAYLRGQLAQASGRATNVPPMHTPERAQPPVQSEEFFRALEERRTRALVQRDLATLEELHAPEYQLITPAGRVFTREAYLGAVSAGPFYEAWEVLGGMNFRLSAHMAVVRYTARLQFPSGRMVVCWHTDSYELRAPGWQAVWSQATEVPPAVSRP